MEVQSIGLGDGTISIRGKEVRININSGGRGKLYGGIGFWRGYRIGIRNISGVREILYEGQGRWGVSVRVYFFLEVEAENATEENSGIL